MNLKLYDKHKSFGIDANLVASMIYLVPGLIGMLIPAVSSFTFLIPIIVYFIERNSKFVRFHCLQYLLLSFVSSLLLYLMLFLIVIDESLAVFAITATNLITVGMFGALVFCVFKAALWRSWRVPYIGWIASKIVKEELDK